MAKLTLKLAPTFKVKVGIPVPGAKAEPVEFTFKTRNREELAAWLDSLDGKKTDEALLEICSGWDLDDAFDADNVALFLSTYIAAWPAVYRVYLDELTKAREKN
jgi:hypothetical protein